MGSGKGTSKRISSHGFTKGSKLDQRYGGGVDYLNDKYASFLTHILNIGRPLSRTSIDTAAVGFDNIRAGQEITEADLKKFKFFFNPDFAESLTDEEMGFVLAHETMHIILNHLRLGNDFEDKDISNIAMDAVINDYLQSIGIDMIMRKNDLGDEVPFGVTGENSVGYDATNSSVTDVYNELYRKKQEDEEAFKDLMESLGKMSIDSHDWIQGAGDGSGGYDPDTAVAGANTPTDLNDTLGDLMDKAMDDTKKNESVPRALDDKKDIDQDGQRQKTYSLTSSDQELEFKDNGLELKWKELLKEIDPDIVKGKGRRSPGYTFARPNRKINHIYPKIVLPSKLEEGPKKDKKVSIVLALDTSGSIGHNVANDFINLAKSIPTDKVDLHVCTFTNHYMPLDLEDPHYVSGGTNFSAINDFINKEVLPNNKNKYPKSVVVITDGDARFSNGDDPTEEEAKSWTWILQDDYDYRRYENGRGDGYGSPVGRMGKMHKLSDFITGRKH